MLLFCLLSCILLKEPSQVSKNSEKKLDPEIVATLDELTIVVEKEKRQISLYEAQKLLEINDKPALWHVGLGDVPEGHKQKEGDEKTPEGLYSFSDHATHSRYHGSILLHYPNTQDAKAGLERKQITKSQYNEIVEAEKRNSPPPMNTDLGGWLLIHGSGKATGLPPQAGEYDWTNGCIAMNNDDLDTLRKGLGDVKGKILILP